MKFCEYFASVTMHLIIVIQHDRTLSSINENCISLLYIHEKGKEKGIRFTAQSRYQGVRVCKLMKIPRCI